MDFAELKIKSKAELADLLLSERQKLHGLRARAAAGNLKPVHQIVAARKIIARILTILRRQQLAR